jgi:hypothetical protein
MKLGIFGTDEEVAAVIRDWQPLVPAVKLVPFTHTQGDAMGTVTEGGNYVDSEGGLYVAGAVNPSPAQDRYDQMRSEGTCVTARHDLRAAREPAVPVVKEAFVAPPAETPHGGAVIPPPTHPDMPDA